MFSVETSFRVSVLPNPETGEQMTIHSILAVASEGDLRYAYALTYDPNGPQEALDLAISMATSEAIRGLESL